MNFIKVGDVRINLDNVLFYTGDTSPISGKEQTAVFFVGGPIHKYNVPVEEFDKIRKGSAV
ncbi:hypothetical protein D1872_181440 [compost metagenome]